MSDADRAPTPQIDAALEASNYALWRAQVAGRLMDAGRHSESLNFQDCGTLFGNFNVAVCEDDPDHDARALPFTCHLRYCPDCERREQARKVARYTPVLKDLAENSDRAGWSLKKIDLTTPYRLDDANAPGLYQDAWDFFETWLQLLFQQLLIDEMTPAEKRRQRISYTAHGVGALAAAEFGEHGHKLHFHCILYSPYVPKQMITDTWRTASGGECEVNWVRRIEYHDVDNAVREQVKYVTKFTELPPALVVQLADVLDGSRRLRTYGLVRKAEKIEPEPCKCEVCAGTISVMKVREYFEYVLAHNIAPKPEIFDAARQIFLDLKHGNNSGEAPSRPTARSDPDEHLQQPDLAGFDGVSQVEHRTGYETS